MSTTAEVIVSEIGRLSVIAARVPDLEREVEQLKADVEHWRSEAMRLGIDGQVFRDPSQNTTEITVRVDNQLIQQAYSPRAMAQQMAVDVVTRLVNGLGKAYGFKP